ncbi:hypothetical protein CALVIDRAFT_528428 [Calocera viscosa TUFC12733]|uniref:Pescadillo homolog n=1 Tax=Calocera viscosa (strain TUFC12733) TaxID=1330018 RepID=A0A167KVY7_CALVF|nr:hypothetical protein CALVIDRAFT_528428 [Calocera viscosa TUFC12733]
MAKITRRGKSGAAKMYMTRTHAVRKLQVSLADFRRLCILKGLYPVEPRSRKKANKGSTAPASFYHAKDIAYLAHEPVLRKLREHKAFAKKLARAIGRQEWFNAKSLEAQEPKYRLDHVIKERYPTFVDAVRDIDDALCLVHLFAMLPANDRIAPDVIENCARLAAEWQLYVMRTQALRKVFLSIKGMYFQAEVMGQNVTWLVPYMFTQHVPADVDFRIMLTFLELYQTLLGFVLFKLYTDENLVYPPPLDQDKDAAAAGVGAFTLKETSTGLDIPTEAPVAEAKGVSAKDVRKVLQGIEAPAVSEGAAEVAEVEPMVEEVDELPVEQPSKTALTADGDAVMDDTDAPSAPSANPSLFSPFVIYISREVTRPAFEFILRSFGARVGWAPTLGSGSPYTEGDERITHVVMDRPKIPDGAIRTGRHYVQPQWVVDCVNKGRILPEGMYAPGQTLPPHLSPFVDDDRVRELGGYVPEEAGGDIAMEEESEEDIEAGEEEDVEAADETANEEEPVEAPKAATKPSKVVQPAKSLPPALVAAAADPTDASLLRAAELEAEAAGVSYAAFQAQLKSAAKKAQKTAPVQQRKKETKEEENMSKIMMTNKKRKLYEKMKYGNEKRKDETERLERKKAALKKQKKA